MHFALFVVSPLLMLTSGLDAAKNPIVKVQTSAGAFTVEIDMLHAPATATNFLKYVDAGRYTGGVVHRTVTMQNQPDKKIKIEVIQSSVNPKFAEQDFPALKLERTSKTKLKHLDGTISMARDGADTATSDFFVCLGKQPELDFGGKRNPDGQGFAAFGHVLKGMEIVRKIQKSPAKEQTLTPPISIVSITRVKK